MQIESFMRSDIVKLLLWWHYSLNKLMVCVRRVPVSGVLRGRSSDRSDPEPPERVGTGQK